MSTDSPRRSHHVCPDRCHRCPDLIAIVAKRGGDTGDPLEITMPGCMGTAAFGPGGCCCSPQKPSTWALEQRRRSLTTEIEQLQADLASVEKQLAEHARMAKIAAMKEHDSPRSRRLVSVGSGSGENQGPKKGTH